MTLAALVVPTFCRPKLSDAGFKPTGCWPVPFRLMVCGLLLALSVMLTVALCAPPVTGEKVTVIVHWPSAGMLLPQVLTWVKVVDPLMLILILESAIDWLLVSVTLGAVLLLCTRTVPKLMLVVDRTTGATPTPESPTFCGLLGALSVSVSDALRLPFAEGVKVTFTVQLCCAGRLGWQLLDWAKSVLLVPVMAMEEK